MTSNEIAKASFLDLLFDNRNKQYGAYALRKWYPQRLATALAGAIAFSVFLILMIAFVQPQKEVKIVDEIFVTPYNLPKELPKEKPVVEKPVSKPAAAPVAQEKHVDLIKIVDDKLVTDPIPPISSLDDAAIGTVTESGPPAPSGVNVSGAGKETGITETKKEESKDFTPLESAPQFPGGQAAWLAFLRRYLQVPADLEPGEKKTVLVRFLVSVDGSITQMEVTQSAGAAFDKEVMRVLRKMPQWKPAIQNGKPVAVPFTQPVTFVGIEE